MDGIGLAAHRDCLARQAGYRRFNAGLDRSPSAGRVFVRNSHEDRYEHKAILWDVRTKTHQVLPTSLSGEDVSYDNASLSPDGKLVAVQMGSERAEAK